MDFSMSTFTLETALAFWGGSTELRSWVSEDSDDISGPCLLDASSMCPLKPNHVTVKSASQLLEMSSSADNQWSLLSVIHNDDNQDNRY